jgi:uncharacterized protein involved in outer membrane biogenesis
MRWLLLVIVLLLAGALAVIVLVDEDTLRAHLEGAAAEALGTEVVIRGDVGLALFPAPHVTAHDVRLEIDGEFLAAFERARVHLKTRPLLSGNVKIRRLHLEGADIRFVRDAEGRFNFQAAEPTPDEEGRMPLIEFSDTTFSYIDETSGAEAEAIGCEGRLPAASPPDHQASPPRSRLEGEFEIRCQAVKVRDFELGDVEIEATAREGQVVLNHVALRLFGGDAAGEVRADFSDDMPHWWAAFALQEFELESLMRTWEPDVQVEGTMNFLLELSATGDELEAIERSLAGRVSLRGAVLRLHGIDLDSRLADYEATQEFGLADAGALLLAGPAGLAVTKGIDFARLVYGDGGESTEFREVVTEWSIEHGVATAEDVAAATAEYRLAALGRIDLAADRFDDFRIVLLDRRGCAEMEQRVSGTLDDPEIEEPGVVETLLGPVIDLVEDIADALTDDECEVVYDGAVAAPGSEE